MSGLAGPVPMARVAVSGKDIWILCFEGLGGGGLFWAVAVAFCVGFRGRVGIRWKFYQGRECIGFGSWEYAAQIGKENIC